MIFSYNIQFVSQEIESFENISIIQIRNFQIFFVKESITNLSLKEHSANLNKNDKQRNYFRKFSYHKFYRFQSRKCFSRKIDEIAKQREIAFLRKMLQIIKVDEKIDFCVFAKFDKILILSSRFENNAKFDREKLYHIMNSKKYFDKNQQKFEEFLR